MNNAQTLMAPGARLRVKVTQADIEGARRGDSYDCVLVMALARAVPRATHIRVDTHTIRFTLEGHRFEYRGHPWSVEDYVRDFDAGVKPEPFTFWVHKPKVTEQQRKPSAPSARRRKPPISRENRGDGPEPIEQLADTARQLADPAKPGRGRPRRERSYGHRDLPGYNGGR